MAALRRRPLALAAAVAVALGAGALAVTSASAAEAPLKDYELTWGIKQSYRSYVTGMAAGSFTPADGATQAAGNGAFTFTDGSGTYDSGTHAVRLGFAGSLKIASKLHGFELTLSDVRFDSAAAEITADVTSGGTTQNDVPLADVTVTRTMTDMETRLTKEAATVLGSAGYEGAAGDPLTVTQKSAATQTPSPTASPTATDSSSPEPTASTSASSSPSSSASSSASSASPSDPASGSASPSVSASGTGAAPQGEIADGTLGWGVKQSFRTYVVDGAAHGRITASGGASQAAGNGAFTFPDATGTYDTEADTLSASFKGAVNFKGHESNGAYGLDLTLSDLAVELDGGSGELTADVDSLGETSDDVVLADLSTNTADLKATDDVITLDGVTDRLTKAGAEAFGGFYAEGAELDPVGLSVALSDDAQLPDGDGGSDSGSGSGSGSGGSGTSSGTTGGAGTTGSTTGGAGGALASTGSEVPAGMLGTAAAVTVAAGAGAVVAMRRRRTV
ncbi:HtaA domain-containing protein [Streptomyces sp. NPDC001914]|uniref:HtaA domain-containing protein n=1 Tax=Streptomyces sp. NPDC001914 TaxID=3364623 RepID=UPI003688572E